METQFKIHKQTTVKAPVETVWQALTTPDMVKQYFFGSELVTTWQVGSAIYFQGEWQGQAYQDKGQVLEYEHNKRLAFSYLSSWSAKEDLPENYLWVCYQVETLDGETLLSINQTNYDEQQAVHSQDNWASIAGEMKKIVEK